ncbi:MAG: dihydrolipoyllysine-residue acetyltransferase [Pseudomonadales bacterium]|nr:dihydrolipoyllysine-residue acetyltransferase [Pseudomonadales bacterium]
MSVQPVLVPDMGVDGPVEVIEINVRVGDELQLDDIVAVMESDKATIEVPASHSGKVEALLIKVGDKVSQGDVLLSLAEAGADIHAKEATKETPASADLPENPTPNTEEKNEKEGNKSISIISVIVPDIGTDSAEVIELIQEGKEINIEESIAVLESDKASMEVPSPKTGKIQKIWVKIGDKLKQGDKLAEIEVESFSTLSSPTVSENNTTIEKNPPSDVIPTASKAASGPIPSPVLSIRAESVHAGPAVRRIAREFGIDVSKVHGSGAKGRILKEDLMAFTKERLSEVPKVSGMLGAAEPLPEIDFGRFGETEQIPRSRIQKISAKNLLRSWNTIPQVTQFDDADITDLEGFRRAQANTAKAEGYKLTLLAFLVKASVAALKKHPDFNSSLDNSGENLIRKQYFHIGIAVETPNGLVVPVVKDADKKGVKEIAIEIISLAEKARNKKLKPAEMQGASFSISSLGGLGGTKFTPIVNWPEVAILGVSKSELRPTYINSELHPRLWLPLSLSYDHRVIDGAAGARFTQTLSGYLSDIRSLVL